MTLACFAMYDFYAARNVVPGGLMFYCCFFMFSAQDLRGLSADRRETLPFSGKCVLFHNLGPNIGPSVKNFKG